MAPLPPIGGQVGLDLILLAIDPEFGVGGRFRPHFQFMRVGELPLVSLPKLNKLAPRSLGHGGSIPTYRWPPTTIGESFMFRVSSLRFVAAFVALAAAQSAFAWNDRGHMLAAMIAYRDLKPEVRDRVNAILKAHPQRDMLAAGGPAEGPDLEMWVFAKAATWPDMVRGTTNPLHQAEHHAQWHYINLPIALDGMKMPQPPMTWDGHSDPANLVQAMAKVTKEVAAKDKDEARRAMDLCWIEHLTGDIHQPLHAVALFSKQFPTGDRGGNSFAVKRGDTPTNLHAYWDNALGNGTSFDTIQKQIAGFKANAELAREQLLGSKPGLDAGAWAKESAELAQPAVYLNGALKGVVHINGDYAKDTPSLPSDYEEKAKKVAAKQVVLAGYRLADQLNALLGVEQRDKPAAHP